MTETQLAPSPCAHSNDPEWENSLWLLASGDLSEEEEERLLARFEACPYCRQHLARCVAAEMRAHRAAPPAAVRPAEGAQEGAGARAFRLVVERVAAGFRCLEAGWNALSPAPATLRGTGAPAPTLYLSRDLLHFHVEVNLSPTPDGRVQIGFSFHDVETGGWMDGRAELTDYDGNLLESLPFKRGLGRFRAVPPGGYWVVLTDNLGLTEMLEVVVQ